MNNSTSTYRVGNPSPSKRSLINLDVRVFLQNAKDALSKIQLHIDEHRDVVINNTPINNENYPMYDTSKILMIQGITKDYLTETTSLEIECVELVKKHASNDGMFLTNENLNKYLKKIRKTSGILYEIDSKCKAMLEVYNRSGMHKRRTFAQTHYPDN